MTRAGRELAIAHRPQLAAQGLLGDRDPELVEHPLHEIDQAPAHDPVYGRDRAVVHYALEFLALGLVQERARARGPAGHQPFPRALKRTTQSRTICKVTQPIRAASLREAPS